ncbi:MAG: hypothetical protein ACK5NC_08635 [Vibrio sp.]
MRRLIKINSRFRYICYLLFIFSAFPSYGEFASNTHIDPLGIEYQSDINVEYGSNDNIYYQHDDNIESSDYYSIKPEFSMAGQHDTKQFYIFYQGDYRSYDNQDLGDNDYDDHMLFANFKWQMGIRHRIDLTGMYNLGHEARGTGVTQGFYFNRNPSGDENQAVFSDFNVDGNVNNKSSNISTKYIYGAEKAKGNLIFEYQRNELSYDLESDYTDLFKKYLKNEEFVETRWIFDFRHQVTDRSRFDYIFMYKDFDYLDNERDNQQYIAEVSYVGQLTGKSKVEASVYYLDNELSERADKSLNWYFMYQWKPVKHSRFELKSLSEVKEADNTGDSVHSYTNSLEWEHEFLGHITTNIMYTRIHHTYEIKDNEETYDTLMMSARYLFRKDIEFTLSYTYSLYSSDDDGDPVFIIDKEYERNLGYKQNIISFGIKVGI